jgi:hypothetical protein
MTITVPFSELFSYLFMAGAVALLLYGVGFEIFDAEQRRLVPQNRFLRILRWFVPSLLCFEDRKDMQAFSRFTAVLAVGCMLLSAYMLAQSWYGAEEAIPWQAYAASFVTVTWATYVVTMVIKFALTLIKAIINFIKG